MKRDVQRTIRRRIGELADVRHGWMTFAAQVERVLHEALPFDRTCWHTVDPDTCLITGSLSHNMTCSGTWLAEHEYVIDDFNKWQDLARNKQRAASLFAATEGALTHSARARSSRDYGLAIGDELRVSFVAQGTYWGSAALIRSEGRQPFGPEEVQFLGSLSEGIGKGFQQALLTQAQEARGVPPSGPCVVLLDARGDLVSVSGAPGYWLSELAESPVPAALHQSRAVQVVAARARQITATGDSAGFPSRARVRTRTGYWMDLYATPLSGEHADRIAVVIQHAGLLDVVPVIARAYGLSESERRIAQLSMKGMATREIGQALGISEHTVQDHCKSIFRKTGVRSRGELIGRVFLGHYVPRFDRVEGLAGGWSGEAIVGADPRRPQDAGSRRASTPSDSSVRR